MAVRKKVWPGRISGRRGMDMSPVSVILGVVFIIFMIKAAPFLYTLLFSKSDIEKCRASVSVKAISIDAASIVTAGKRISDPLQLDLDCHTKFLVAKKDGVYDGIKRTSDFSDRSFEGMELDDKLKKEVADRMRDCWYMFGNGETDPFSKLGGDIHCVECYELQFDDEVKKEVQDKKGVSVLTDFTGFLASSFIDEKQTTTYSQYLYKSSDVPKESKGYNLYLSKQYGVVYFRGTFKFADELAKGVLGASVVGGCLTGAQVGLVGGSFFGPIGTVVGGIVGAGAGCAGGLLVGIRGADDASGIGKAIGVAVVPVESLGEKCGKLY